MAVAGSTLRTVEVVIQTQSGVIGVLSLEGDQVVGDTDAARDVLEHIKIVEPDTLLTLTPDKGARYLAAVPATLNGAYVWATVR